MIRSLGLFQCPDRQTRTMLEAAARRHNDTAQCCHAERLLIGLDFGKKTKSGRNMPLPVDPIDCCRRPKRRLNA
jgi:hypothetical protein